MGIMKFLRYGTLIGRSSRQCSSCSGAIENFGKSNSLGKIFDSNDLHQDKNCTDDANVMEHKIMNDEIVVRSFSWDEIAKITTNFSEVIGYGGFSKVYLAHLPDTTLRAIKIHTSTTERLYRVFKQELEILLHIHHHDHIVKFLGFYDDQKMGVLVFEYVENGTLQDKLHGDEVLVLSWTKRMQIAYQVVQTLEYLHERCSPHIVHGDIKSSNILLNSNFDSKLCDFGSAKMGISSTMALLPRKQQHQFMMMGSPGYVDPHYLRTGIASKKNDIYSFGVLLLELITGMEAFNPETGNMMASSTDNAMKLALDPRLDGNFDPEEATVILSIARLCLDHPPTLRPSASEIVFSMQHQIPSIFAQ